MAKDDTDPKYRAPALDKGLDIIELLTESEHGLTLAEIARELRRSQSEIYRMTTTLLRRGYVMRCEATDRFSLRLKMFALARRHAPLNRMLDVAPPRLRDLSRRSQQSCHLTMESNGDIVIVAASEAPNNWAFGVRIGARIGLCNTAPGRVLAAFRHDDDLEELLQAHRRAQGEPDLDRAAFLARLGRIRKRGYERMSSATAVGVTSMSYPILDQEGRAVLALNCPYLERIDSFPAPSIEEVHEMHLQLSRDLSAFYSGC